jgi:hypothetical protein
MPLEVAINLAAYVTYQVKRTVKDAGLDTDILVMRKNSIFHHVSFDEIAEMETKFREYEDVEQESLYYCLGGNFPPHQVLERKRRL